MPYPYYQNNQYYMQDLQAMKDRIDNQIRNFQQQNQMQQPVQQPITQNFQLASNPTNSDLESKYADNVEEVKNTFVMKTGVFVNKDFSTMWIKDVTGNIRTFRTDEIIELDEKDKEIYMLKKQIEEMKGMIANANDTSHANVNESTTNKRPSRASNNSKTNTK